MRHCMLQSSKFFFRSTFVALVTVAACRSESAPIHRGKLLLRPTAWTRVPIGRAARGDRSQVCVVPPIGYRYDGAKDEGPVVTDTNSKREVLISGRFVRSDSTVVPAGDFDSGGRFTREEGVRACISLPPRARGVVAAIELMSSDTLTIRGLYWNTYYLNAFPPF
jgi:hypothetical protein